MAEIQNIVEEHNIIDPNDFQKAMTKAGRVSEGELHYIAGFDPGGQSVSFRQQVALAKAELGRRSAAEKRKLTWITAMTGMIGVLVGAFLQVGLN